MDERDQDKRDAVTVGQIRQRMQIHLENQIHELGKIIREGHHKIDHAKKFLDENITRTLIDLDNINAAAISVVLFSDDQKH